jgi:RNA polymerase sigma-70 factor, ECF subfamily
VTTPRNPGELDTRHVATVEFSAFYEEHFGFVWSCLHRLGVPTTDLEDATHDVFVVVHRRHEELALASSPKGWLFGIVRRVASNRRRGAWRQRRRIAAIRDVGVHATQPDRDLERTDAAHVVTRFLDGLAEPQRHVFVLSELQQMTAREVAEILDINPNTASSRLRAARKAFDHFAARVREEDPHHREVVLAQARRADVPSRKAQPRVRRALAISLGPVPKTALVLPGLGAWTKSATIAVAIGSAALGAVVVVSSLALKPAPRQAGPSGDAVASQPRDPPIDRAHRALGELPEETPREISTVGAHVDAETGIGAKTLPGASSDHDRAAGRRQSSPARSRPQGLGSDTKTAPGPAPVAGSTASTDELVRQNDLLTGARRALARGDNLDATRLAAEYREHFATGPFTVEFALIEIRARCAAGDEAAARRLGRRFVLDHPGSPHIAVVDQTCAGPITKSGSSGD